MGDPFGMAIAHAQAVGMGGMRTSGDLVARMPVTRCMSIHGATRNVAHRQGVGVEECAAPNTMSEVKAGVGWGRT